MLCKCKYFLSVNGGLICSQCGKPAHSPAIEDKMMPQPENKKIKKVK